MTEQVMPVMRDNPLDGRVPARHERPQVVEVAVARVDARKVGEAMLAGQVRHAARVLPEVPAQACLISIAPESPGTAVYTCMMPCSKHQALPSRGK